MLEGEFTRRLVRALRAHPALAEAVVWRHIDRFTAGEPDISVSIGKHTEHFELKVHPNKPTKLQSYYLKRLGAGGHLVTVAKDLHWARLDDADSHCQKQRAFNWLISNIVRICVNL